MNIVNPRDQYGNRLLSEKDLREILALVAARAELVRVDELPDIADAREEVIYIVKDEDGTATEWVRAVDPRGGIPYWEKIGPSDYVSEARLQAGLAALRSELQGELDAIHQPRASVRFAEAALPCRKARRIIVLLEGDAVRAGSLYEVRLPEADPATLSVDELDFTENELVLVPGEETPERFNLDVYAGERRVYHVTGAERGDLMTVGLAFSRLGGSCVLAGDVVWASYRRDA